MDIPSTATSPGAKSREKSRRLRGRLLSCAAVGWCVLVAACSGAILWSARQAGAAAEPPSVLPRSIGAGTAAGRSTVIVAIHPHCPCSRATVANLERALPGRDGSCRVVALIYAPSERPAAWEDTDVVRRLAAIDGVERVEDRDGRESDALGMKTSGQVLVYDGAGALRFTGGITPSRGHEGPCSSLDAFTSLISRPSATLLGGERAVAAATVFGCPLCAPTAGTPCPTDTGARP